MKWSELCTEFRLEIERCCQPVFTGFENTFKFRCFLIPYHTTNIGDEYEDGVCYRSPYKIPISIICVDEVSDQCLKITFKIDHPGFRNILNSGIFTMIVYEYLMYEYPSGLFTDEDVDESELEGWIDEESEGYTPRKEAYSLILDKIESIISGEASNELSTEKQKILVEYSLIILEGLNLNEHGLFQSTSRLVNLYHDHDEHPLVGMLFDSSRVLAGRMSR